MRRVWGAALLGLGAFVFVVAACSSSTPDPGPAALGDAATSPDTSTSLTDAGTSDALPASDAGEDAGGDGGDGAAVVLKRIAGAVEYDGKPVANAAVTVLSPTSLSTTTDSKGEFAVYLPLGAAAVFKVVPLDPTLFPMIRGIVVGPTNRIRIFYLAGPPERAAATALGLSLDPAKGIVEVDFRNSTTGGYSTTIRTSGGAALTPGFGVVLDAMGNPTKSSSTLTGGDGSTLLLGDVTPATVSFTPITPDAGVLPCKPCDAPELPIQANTVTWFDFECGSATDCQ